MKKCSFILIEVTIALSLLALCAFPLITNPLVLSRKMKTHFFELELERKVNVIAYDIIKQGILFKNLTPTVSNQTPLPPFELSIEGIGKKRFVGHYHLYHCIPEKHTSPYYKIWLGICFDKKKCKPQHKSFQFSFSFLGKIMDEKSPISHGDGKEPIQVKDERVPVDIQTIHQSQ